MPEGDKRAIFMQSAREMDYKNNLEHEARDRNIESKVNACMEQHIVDISPGWEGDKKLARTVSGGFVGLASARVNRCEPNLSIPKLSLEGGKSVVLIGPNGSGKSTLFDAIMQRNNADVNEGVYGYNKGLHGKESLRISRLDQEELLSNVDDLEVERVLAQVQKKFKGEFLVNWDEVDAYDKNLTNQAAQQRIEELMAKVANLFEINLFLKRKVSELSGGERTKLALMMILGSEPDVLLLDEPTNHLDLESIAKLSGLFEKYKKAGVSVVSVSHVEWFLDMVGKDGTMELEVNEQKRLLNTSASPYGKYIKKEEKKKSLIEGNVEWNSEYQRGGKSLFISKEKFSVPNSPLKDIALPTIQGVDLTMFSGKNGTGKTKLMEEMADRKSKLIGKEKGVQIAYMPQFWPDAVASGTVGDFFQWIKDEVNPHSDKTGNQFKKKLRDLKFDNGRRDVLKEPLSAFSGGEQRLLWFVAASVFEGTDALLLDEPSNHMDGATMEHVVNIIRRFNGSVVLSTHDLRLMKELEKNPGNLRAGIGIKNIIFERREGDSSTIYESKQSPVDYAESVIKEAKKSANRINIG